MHTNLTRADVKAGMSCLVNLLLAAPVGRLYLMDTPNHNTLWSDMHTSTYLLSLL